MTPDEERRAKAAENKRAYRLRKKQEEQARMQDFRRIAEATPNPLSKEQQQEAALRIAKTHGLPVFESTPNPDLESAWKRVQPGKIEPISAEDIVHYVDSKEKADAIQTEAVAREEYVQLLFSKYEKTTNIPQLLAGILRETIETRVVMTDLLAEILKEMQK